MTKFCVNCKHYQAPLCQRPTGLSLVTGVASSRNVYAEIERTLSNTGCGSQANYFESIFSEIPFGGQA